MGTLGIVSSGSRRQLPHRRPGVDGDLTLRSRPKVVGGGVLSLAFLGMYVAVLVPSPANTVDDQAVGGAVVSVLFWAVLRIVLCPHVRLTADRLVVVNPVVTYSVGSREIAAVMIDSEGASVVRLRSGKVITSAALAPSAIGAERGSAAGRRFVRQARAWLETAAPADGVHRSVRPAFVWLVFVEAAWLVVWLGYVASTRA